MITIKTKKIVYKNKKFFYIQKVQALTFDQLPKRYTRIGIPVVYQTNSKVELRLVNTEYFNVPNSILEGDYIAKNKFEKIIEFIEIAGEELKNYNLAKQWKGIQTFNI